MNIILVERDEVKNGSVILQGRRASHIVKILKANEGDLLKVGMINGGVGSGEVVECKKKYPHVVKLILHNIQEKPMKPRLDLLLALPRPIMLKRILCQVTALGVGKIFLINANRVEKSFWKASLLEEDNYSEHLLAGLEQCVDTVLPEVETHNKFLPFIEDYFPGIKSDYGSLIVADPSGESTIAEIPKSTEGRSMIAIGPEGGWVDFELEKFNQYGFCACNMGRRILKVDTAVVAMHAQFTAINGLHSDTVIFEENNV